MERNTPVRKPHTSTADLLTWSETPPPVHSIPGSASSRSNTRSHQPSGVSKVVFGGQVTDEEVESLNKRKPCSGYKLKEITGSGIFNGEGGAAEPNGANSASKTGLRMYQQTVSGISHISFGEEESLSPKKPTSIPEVAKQRELSGTLDNDSDPKTKLISDAKCKELSGHDIFAPPPEIVTRPYVSRHLTMTHEAMGEPAPREIRTSVKVSSPAGGQSTFSHDKASMNTAKKIYDKKYTELSGNDIFRGDTSAAATGERFLSTAKLREISGNNIFADGKAESRDYFGGVRKPPGGESSISLV